MSNALENQEREAWDGKVWGPLKALARIVLVDGWAERLMDGLRQTERRIGDSECS